PSAPLRRFLEEPVAVPKGAGDGIRELRSALEACRDEASMAPAAQLERIRAYLDPVIARKYDAPGPRSADLEQLAQLARGYESRGRFLAELTLDPPASTADLAGAPLLDEDYLILSTIQSTLSPGLPVSTLTSPTSSGRTSGPRSSGTCRCRAPPHRRSGGAQDPPVRTGLRPLGVRRPSAPMSTSPRPFRRRGPPGATSLRRAGSSSSPRLALS